MPPTSIDGTDISGATIDGTEVTEITADGDVVFTAGGSIVVDGIAVGTHSGYDQIASFDDNLNQLDTTGGNIETTQGEVNEDGSKLFVGNDNNGEVVKINTSDMSVDTSASLNGQAVILRISSTSSNDNLFVVTNNGEWYEFDRNLNVINQTNNTYSGDGWYSERGVAGEDGNIYFGERNNTSIWRVDPETFTIDEFTAPGIQAFSMTWADGHIIYGNEGNDGKMEKMDPSDMSVVDTLTLSTTTDLTDMGTGDNGLVYVGGKNGEVFEVDPTNLTENNASNNIGSDIRSIVVGKNYIWIASRGDDSVYKVDISDLSQVDSVSYGDQTSLVLPTSGGPMARFMGS